MRTKEFGLLGMYPNPLGYGCFPRLPNAVSMMSRGLGDSLGAVSDVFIGILRADLIEGAP